MVETFQGRLTPYPAERAAMYRHRGLWSSTPTAERFHESAVAHAQLDAVIDREGRLTYADLDRRTDQIATALGAMGLRPHDPVIFQATNHIGTVLAWYGVLKAGAIPVGTLAAHRAHEIGQISRKVGAVAHVVDARVTNFDLQQFAREQAADHPTLRVILTVGAQANSANELQRLEDLGADIDPRVARTVVKSIQAGLDPEDVAVFQLSGGTTGIPKLIPRLHAEYWNNALFYARRLGRTSQTRAVLIPPVIHNAGITCQLHGVHAVGGCVVLTQPDLVEATRMMADNRVNEALFGHAMYHWVETPEYAAAAKYVQKMILSGAKVPPAVFDRAEELGATVGQLFGMSEGLFTVTPLDGPRQARLLCVGTPIADGDEFRILDPDSERELPDGEIGELACRGSYTIAGYFDAAEHNRTAFTSDGFYRTGDLAKAVRYGSERHLSVEGRIKDMINRGGEKINAEELELLLGKHAAIAEAAVVAMPDSRLGERVCAYVVANGAQVDLADIRRHFEALGVAKYKWPERLEWVDSLPRTTVGKVDKKQLRLDIAEKILRDIQPS